MGSCVHMCVEDEEKGGERARRERKEEYLVLFFSNCASTAVSSTDWSKSGSCMACAQISQASNGVPALTVLKIRYFIL